MPTPLQMFMMKSGKSQPGGASNAAPASYGGLEGFEGGGFTNPGLSFGFNPTSAGFSLAKSLAFGTPISPLGLVSAFTNYDPGDVAGYSGYDQGALPGMPGAPAHQAGFPGAIANAAKAKRDKAKKDKEAAAGQSSGGFGKGNDPGGGTAGSPF